MNNPLSYYQQHLETYKTEAERLFKRMTTLSILRVLVFLATGFGVYLAFENWQVSAIIGVSGVAIFIYLLSRYTDLKSKRNLHKRLIAINEEELKKKYYPESNHSEK